MGVTTHLKERLMQSEKRCNNKKGDAMVLLRSYDIKEMFTSLPHDAIIDVVDWLLQEWEVKGREKVSVSRRGKEVVMNQKSRGKGYVQLSFQLIREYVKFELNHTYTTCRGTLLMQIVGIPMGKNSSPLLTCIQCTKYETEFMRSLGKDGALVQGIRFMVDVTTIVLVDRRMESSFHKAERILKQFEGCYGRRLLLVRTNEGGNTIDFIGIKVAMCMSNSEQKRAGIDTFFQAEPALVFRPQEQQAPPAASAISPSGKALVPNSSWGLRARSPPQNRNEGEELRRREEKLPPCVAPPIPFHYEGPGVISFSLASTGAAGSPPRRTDVKDGAGQVNTTKDVFLGRHVAIDFDAANTIGTSEIQSPPLRPLLSASGLGGGGLCGTGEELQDKTLRTDKNWSATERDSLSARRASTSREEPPIRLQRRELGTVDGKDGSGSSSRYYEVCEEGVHDGHGGGRDCRQRERGSEEKQAAHVIDDYAALANSTVPATRAGSGRGGGGGGGEEGRAAKDPNKETSNRIFSNALRDGRGDRVIIELAEDREEGWGRRKASVAATPEGAPSTAGGVKWEASPDGVSRASRVPSTSGASIDATPKSREPRTRARESQDSEPRVPSMRRSGLILSSSQASDRSTSSSFGPGKRFSITEHHSQTAERRRKYSLGGGGSKGHPPRSPPKDLHATTPTGEKTPGKQIQDLWKQLQGVKDQKAGEKSESDALDSGEERDVVENRNLISSGWPQGEEEEQKSVPHAEEASHHGASRALTGTTSDLAVTVSEWSKQHHDGADDDEWENGEDIETTSAAKGSSSLWTKGSDLARLKKLRAILIRHMGPVGTTSNQGGKQGSNGVVGIWAAVFKKIEELLTTSMAWSKESQRLDRLDEDLRSLVDMMRFGDRLLGALAGAALVVAALVVAALVVAALVVAALVVAALVVAALVVAALLGKKERPAPHLSYGGGAQAGGGGRRGLGRRSARGTYLAMVDAIFVTLVGAASGRPQLA
ncbi:hypothetical protein CBR_g52031 [Chara braunii]|uniref:Reverse transcriptase domain-containing protein n=1 Tax=Chara braunii TaxID=69332 RepID=A0A388M9C9_CHABU|nr:hypothetical protein CBR_g52031 [Chara braunii]|eukprot:GBG91150.1 hypothetical protein CBR_g52031 [Chara braunii]